MADQGMTIYNKRWAVKRLAELKEKIRYYKDRIDEKSKKLSNLAYNIRKGQNDIDIMKSILIELSAEKEYLENKYFPTPIPIWMFPQYNSLKE